MPDIAAQLAALWKRVNIIKLVMDPEFVPVLASVIALLKRNLNTETAKGKR